MHPCLHRPSAGLVSVLLAAALVGGCSSSESPEPEGGQTSPSASSDAEPAPGAPSATVTTKATVAQVVGEFDADRQRLRDRIAESIDAWIDAAYLGDFPRTDFSDAFASFTPRARTLAERDRDLLSNADIGGELTAVEALTRRVRIDVLASEGKAVGVTARVRIRLRLSGPTEREERIVGRVFLGFRAAAHGWRIFGYKLKRGEV